MIDLKLKINNLPLLPGCYLMKDIHNNIIYVGKAKYLKKRVSQYFVGAHDYKTQQLVSNIVDFDFIITNSEKEALLLEINLIKLHRPRFNIMFMDDKTYPYIKVDTKHLVHLSVVREKEKDKKNNYFGPYPSSVAAHEVINLLNILFPLRKCQPLKSKPCLYYYLKQCLAPCLQEVEVEINNKYLKEVTDILKGRVDNIIKDLKHKMADYSQRLLFEKADVVKKQIESLEHISLKQNVMGYNKNLKIDVINYYELDGFISICILLIRNGRIVDKITKIYPLNGIAEDIVLTFILQYYQDKDFSDKMLINSKLDLELLSSINSGFINNKKGKGKDLLDNALINAREYLTNQLSSIKHQHFINDQGITYLSNILKIKQVNSIEMLDVSHIHGMAVGGVIVRYENGEFFKKKYRTYLLDNINNDPLSIASLLNQHIQHLLKHESEFPDIIMIDGGSEQVSSAIKVMNNYGYNIPIIGIVKDNNHNSDHLLYNGYEYMLDRNSAIYFFLANIQDEVHRFALKFHKKLRNKNLTKSYLDNAPMIGKKRKKLILDKYVTLQIARGQSKQAFIDLLGVKIGTSFYEWIQSHEVE